jgi:rod shape-determining protein MreC
MIFSFVTERRRYVLLISYLILSLFFMIVNNNGIMKSIRAAFFNTLGYGTALVNDLNTFASDSWYSIRKMEELKQELQTAYGKIQLLQDASIEIETLKRENVQLKSLLSYRKAIPFSTVPAEIIASDPKAYFNTIIVDKGYSDGVEVNMPVIAYQDGKSGVVGKVFEVGASSSKILLMSDDNSYISAMLYGTGYSGLARGMGRSQPYLNFLYVDRNAMINFGDLVVTSGQGGVFPKGITVGAVISVNDSKYGFYYNEIKIAPFIDLSRLDSVFIILKSPSREIQAMTGKVL